MVPELGSGLLHNAHRRGAAQRGERVTQAWSDGLRPGGGACQFLAARLSFGLQLKGAILPEGPRSACWPGALCSQVASLGQGQREEMYLKAAGSSRV